MANKHEELDVIQGIVSGILTAKKNDSDKWMPAKIYIKPEGSEVEVIAYPYRDYDTGIVTEPILLPPWFQSLDLETLKGSAVQVVAVPTLSDYTGKIEYRKVKSFKVVGTAQPSPEVKGSVATPQPTAPSQPNQPKPYAPESRMEIGMATGNAKNGGYTVVSAYYEKHGELPNDEFLTAFAERVNFFADALMNPPEEEVALAVEEVEPEDELPIVGSI